jgi:uncharacterized protein
MNRLTKTRLSMQVKALDDAQGTFTGLGAAFGNLDYNGDIIERGAFTETLGELKTTQRKYSAPFLLPLLFMHDEKSPCGGISNAYETADGLAIECQCDLNTELGRMAFSGIKMGYANGLSIGYNTVRSTRDAKGVRHLLGIKLWEVSVITMGYAANPLALSDALSAKGRQGNSMNSDATSQRVPFAPYRHPYVSAEARMPRIEDYPDEAKFVTAYRAWQTKAMARQGAAPPTIADQSAAWQDERARLPYASVEDVRAYYARHGRTPDGRKMPDNSGEIVRAVEAFQSRLAEAKK